MASKLSERTKMCRQHVRQVERELARRHGQRTADKLLCWFPLDWPAFNATQRAGFLDGLAAAFDAYAEGLRS